MIDIRNRVVTQWNDWGYNFIEDIEEIIDRELTEEEILDMVIYISGYYAPKQGTRKLSDFLSDIGLDSVYEENSDELEDKTIEI